MTNVFLLNLALSDAIAAFVAAPLFLDYYSLKVGTKKPDYIDILIWYVLPLKSVYKHENAQSEITCRAFTDRAMGIKTVYQSLSAKVTPFAFLSAPLLFVCDGIKNSAQTIIQPPVVLSSSLLCRSNLKNG